jgi:diguanylate cyclase (GGDEF)-like protein
MEISYEIQEKWRSDLFRICVILAVIGSICEVVIYCIDASTKTLFLPNNIYRIRFIYIPSTLNLLMILLTLFYLKTKSISNAAKNCWSCALILFLCINTQFIHYVYGPLLALPCLAIFVSVLFANKKLTLSLFLVSCASIAVSCLQASRELRKDDPQLLTDMGLAMVIMLVSYIGSSLLIRYVQQQISFILQSGKRESELLYKLQLDNLLGIYNRSKLDYVLDELTSSKNIGVSDAVLMIDIDDFKNVNDQYGHLNGDQVLIRLADLIRQKVKRNMVPCRYGGEEIVIVFRGTAQHEVYDFAETLREEFYRQVYDFAPELKVSFSGGIAVFNDGMTREEWLKQADANMYQAKAAGKNTIYPNKTLA